MTAAEEAVEGIDPERQRLARQYARRRYLLMIVGAALSLGYLLAYPLALSTPLVALASRTGLPVWAQAALFALLAGGAFELLTFPLAWYGGLVLRQRYGLSTQSFGAWLLDVVKGWGVALVLGLIALEGLYACLWFAPERWWLLVWAFSLALSVLLSFVAPVLIFPIFFEFTPLGDTPLARRLLELAKRTGTAVQGVYSVNLSSKTTEGNAALMGIGRTRRIALGDTLLDQYSAEETEAVLAHELAHHVHNDIWRGLAFQAVELLAVFYLAHLALARAIDLGLAGAAADLRSLPLIALAMGVVSTLLSPLGAWHSRRMERQADDFAADILGVVRGFVSAMVKLANQNLAVVDPHPLLEFLLYSHPSIGRRVRRALRYERFARGRLA